MLHGMHSHTPFERLNQLWRQGVRLAMRAAVALGLSTATGIALGVALTDSALVQILIITFAAVGFWLPFLFLILAAERLLTRRGRSARAPASLMAVDVQSRPADDSWRRLAAVAPQRIEHLTVLRRSLERSRTALGDETLDFDAHELCVLIDRRLPELIDRELDNLAPDDRNRERQLNDLVGLIEQFARHCSRRRSEEGPGAQYDADVLRRRFEARLSSPWETLPGPNRQP